MAKPHRDKTSQAPHHHARHSTSSHARVKAVRLTPAEIRAQNNGELARSQSQPVSKPASKQLSEGHVTPPPSPSRESTAYQTQLARAATVTERPPTPPRSPRLSHAKAARTRQDGIPPAQPQIPQYRQSMPAEAYRGIMSIPAANASRTSSISGSIKAPMKYRGHELTRTGSLAMFQAPQPDIVMNPLSHFSRPRNKYSPPASFSRQAGNGATSYQSQHRRNDTMDSFVSSPISASDEFVVRSTSPVSARTLSMQASRQFVIVTEDSMPKTEDQKEDTQGSVVTALPPVQPEESGITALPAVNTIRSPRRFRDMKKTASVDLAQAVVNQAEKETKHKRRHTFSWKRMSGMDLKSDFKNDLSPPKEAPVAIEAETPIPQPIVEPREEQVASPTKEDKGKGKEVVHDHTTPQVVGVKHCCDKCGRIKKLQDGRVIVSDGKTNDTLVVAGSSAYKLVTTNADRPKSRVANPAGAANAAQLIMHRQRRPKQDPPPTLSSAHVVKDFAAIPAAPAATAQDASTSEQILPDPPVRITRFASLHGVSQDKTTSRDLPPVDTTTTTTTPSPSSSNDDEIPQMLASSTPVDEPLPQFAYDPTGDDDELFVEAPTQQRRRYSFESQRSFIDVTPLPRPGRAQTAEDLAANASASVVARSAEPIDLSKPLVLPEPNLGLHFARSNLTLRGLVVPKGGSSADLLGDSLAAAERVRMDGVAVGSGGIEEQVEAAERMEREKKIMVLGERVGEIMAV